MTIPFQIIINNYSQQFKIAFSKKLKTFVSSMVFNFIFVGLVAKMFIAKQSANGTLSSR